MTSATFLLVHGAFHGGWCWERVIPQLGALGHRAEPIDLPRAPGPVADPDRLLSLWVDDVLAALEPYAAPVILVGHSRAGLVISQAAERAPHRIARSVYCAAMLVDSGETMRDARARLGPHPAAPLRFRTTDTVLHLDPASAAECIYSGSSAGDREWATSRLTPEPEPGFRIAPRLTASRYGSVPRAAIECLRDTVMPIALQRGMRRSQPCDVVVTLDCDHAPYLSDPIGLSAALDGIARMPRTALPC